MSYYEEKLAQAHTQHFVMGLEIGQSVISGIERETEKEIVISDPQDTEGLLRSVNESVEQELFEDPNLYKTVTTEREIAALYAGAWAGATELVDKNPRILV